MGKESSFRENGTDQECQDNKIWGANVPQWIIGACIICLKKARESITQCLS